MKKDNKKQDKKQQNALFENTSFILVTDHLAKKDI